MPTTWNRSPEDFHKIYLANTDAFYRIDSNSLAPELDDFMTKCALQLWSRAGGIGERHVAMANQIYSRGRPQPKWLLWNLTGSVCNDEMFLPPVFFWNLAEKDVKRGTETSRTFIRMTTNILLYLAAVDDDVTYAEAEYITECTDKLTAICDTTGVKKTREGLNPLDYVTSGEPSFIEKHTQQAQPAGGGAKNSAKTEEKEPEKPNFDELMEELNSLVGLETVKKEVKNLMNLVKVRKLREENDLPVPPMSFHMVFLGNPGTGKTTVARLVSGLYAAIGVLSKGQLIEVDRSGLVAGYVGQTAGKVTEVVKSALGGILFIDEAYALARKGMDNDFGREAIDTLVKLMEDNRDNLVVIVAGYTDEMHDFLTSNPGLISRFNKYIDFPDYTDDELMAILAMNAKKQGYVIGEEANAVVRSMLEEMTVSDRLDFGNARGMRNTLEKLVQEQANRIAGITGEITKDMLCQIIEADAKTALCGEDAAEEQETENIESEGQN
jgi:SpoVK/Ycf46/Vps4 family AAA+-type ATPase